MAQVYLINHFYNKNNNYYYSIHTIHWRFNAISLIPLGRSVFICCWKVWKNNYVVMNLSSLCWQFHEKLLYIEKFNENRDRRISIIWDNNRILQIFSRPNDYNQVIWLFTVVSSLFMVFFPCTSIIEVQQY